MATVGFAYGSFGDILDTIKLGAKIIELIRNGGRPSSEWAETAKEMQSLCSILTYLTTFETTLPLPPSITTELQKEVALCRATTSEFESKITASRGFFQRVLWATSEEKELAAFRRQLIQRRVALSGVVDEIQLVVLKGVQDRVEKVDEKLCLGIQQLGDQGQTLAGALLHVRDRVSDFGEEMRLGHNQLHDTVSGVTQQLQDQEQTLSGTLLGVRDRVEEVREEVRLGTQQLMDQEQTLNQSHLSNLEEKLRKWLKTPSEVAEKQHEMQKLHHTGTGGWFLDGHEFRKWKENAGLLWMKGQSGTGKSVLSSTVISKLFEDRQQGTAVAYFYFDFRDKQKQLVEMMLRSIILQLSAQSHHPYAALNSHYELLNGQALPTYQNLVDILETLLSEKSYTYIVLDALDECKDTNLLIQLVSRLQRWTGRPLHILLTSQAREIFGTAFAGISEVALEFDTTQSDIKLFVSNELRSNPDLDHLAHRAEQVATKVVTKSGGMFRLAACLLDELSRQKLDPDMDVILANLPNDLFGIYSRFLEPIHQRDFDYVARILCWLVFSARPMTLQQLTDSLAFEFSDPNRFVFDRTKRGSQAIGVCKILQGLVTVGNDTEYLKRGEWKPRFFSPVVALAHSSVADYIVSDAFREKHKHGLTKGPSHTFLAQTCVGYLLHFASHPFDKIFLTLDYPLAEYAAWHWDYHLVHCDDRAILFTSTMCLLESGSHQYGTLDYLRGDTRIWGGPQTPPLVLCSEMGYIEGIHFLLKDSAEVDGTGGKYDNVLQAAIQGGHIDIVQILLENGAKITAAHKSTLLQAASRSGSEDAVQLLLGNGAEVGRTNETILGVSPTNIVQLLLEHGAEVNKEILRYHNRFWGDRDTGDGSPCNRGNTQIVRVRKATDRFTLLHAASKSRSKDLVKFLLDNGAEVNAANQDGQTALDIAIQSGDAETVRVLLEKGATDAQEGYNSALCSASKSGCIDIVQLLLAKGTEVNGSGAFLGDALRSASKCGYIDIVQLLLAKRTEVNTPVAFLRDALEAAYQGGHVDIVQLLLEKGPTDVQDGYTIELCKASERGYIDIVQLLLDNGADVNAESGYYGAALQRASWYGHTDIVQLLLDNDADINAEGGSEYGSALQAATWHCHTDIIQLLLKHGANINAEDGFHGNALRIASGSGRLDVVRLLLEKGATDVHFGGLCSASDRGHIAIVRLLLDHGAANTTGGFPGGALQAASREGHRDIVQLLLEHGADINASNGLAGGKALQAASRNGHADVVRLLLEKGATNLQERHNSALCSASESGHIDIVQLLIDQGSDVNAEGGIYPLQAASRNGYTNIVRLLLEHGADANATAGFSESALQVSQRNGHTDIVRLLLEHGAQQEDR
ncbi:ankyrin repeat-containing domain protein [Mycena maculata]|uniref:Ankyrin repeat-containing domain protein n=1 Tax=Mycena maculata TaxID=230809 RepID=A0AAD7JGT3_9AGAR|nr:ankyrin repeat-containing domain protein [Mycena maculata]